MKYKKTSIYLQSGHNRHFLKCTFSKSLTHNYVNLKDPYSQSIKLQVNTKDIKKGDRLCMKSSIPEAQCSRGVFQIQHPICSVNFSNNISVPQLKVSTRETEHDMTFETSQLLTSRINPSIVLQTYQGFICKCIPTVVGENFQIYRVHITEKRICETLPLL